MREFVNIKIMLLDYCHHLYFVYSSITKKDKSVSINEFVNVNVSNCGREFVLDTSEIDTSGS